MMRLADLVKEYGIKNLCFFIQMCPLEMAGFIPGIALTSSNSVRHTIECKIDEQRYKIVDNYKVTFSPVRPTDQLLFGKENFYQMDAEAIFELSAADRDLLYRAFVLTPDGYSPVQVSRF